LKCTLVSEAKLSTVRYFKQLIIKIATKRIEKMQLQLQVVNELANDQNRFSHVENKNKNVDGCRILSSASLCYLETKYGNTMLCKTTKKTSNKFSNKLNSRHS
jgi:hypothetical protein